MYVYIYIYVFKFVRAYMTILPAPIGGDVWPVPRTFLATYGFWAIILPTFRLRVQVKQKLEQ